MNRPKYAGKYFCFCTSVYKTYGGKDFNKLYEALSKVKIKKNKNEQFFNRKI